MRTILAIAVLLVVACGLGPLLPAAAGVASAAEEEAGDVMPADRFWQVIGKTTQYQADPERQLEALRQVLRGLTVTEIEAFERAFHRQQRRAYSWDLWGAAYVMNGGASDDGFEYFQRWLVSKGRTAFEAAIADPDSLAEMIAPDPQGDCEFEQFANVASDIWKEKTGIDAVTDQQRRFPFCQQAAGRRAVRRAV